MDDPDARRERSLDTRTRRPRLRGARSTRRRHRRVRRALQPGARRRGPTLAAFEHPTPPRSVAPPAWALARYVGHDAGETLVLAFVRPKDGVPESRIRDAVLAADPSAVVTGWPLLERALQDSLARDLP